jgi:carbon storage regulator
MLLLKVKPGEAIVISDNIRVVALAVTEDGHIRLGIDAPKSVIVNRESIHKRILLEREADAQMAQQLQTEAMNARGNV